MYKMTLYKIAQAQKGEYMPNPLQFRIMTPEEYAASTYQPNTVYLVKDDDIEGQLYVDMENQRISINGTTDSPVNISLQEIDENKLVPDMYNGDINQVLTVQNDNGNLIASWEDAPAGSGGTSLPDYSDAQNGQVLTADGAGNISWEDPSSGGSEGGLPDTENISNNSILYCESADATPQWQAMYPDGSEQGDVLIYVGSSGTGVGWASPNELGVLPDYSSESYPGKVLKLCYDMDEVTITPMWDDILPYYDDSGDYEGAVLKIVNGNLEWVMPE